MLDHRLFLKNTEEICSKLKTRGLDDAALKQVQRLADQRLKKLQHVEQLRQELNQQTKNIQQKSKSSDPAAIQELRNQLKTLKTQIKSSETELSEVEQAFQNTLLYVPNLPDDTVPVGPDASGNRIDRTVGTKRTFSFEPKPHWELGANLGILDFQKAASISGSRFVVYKKAGARLERALAAFMLDLAKEHGYTEVIPPFLVRKESMVFAGQYPKFEGDSFETLDREYVLIPTAEVPLVNLHADEIMDGSQLPLRYVAHTPCFRREAGAAGKDTRGLIRQHQFSKVELVSFVTPEKSQEELERLTHHAEEVLKRLELSYQVVSLCTGDLGFAAGKTYDLEVWLPGQQAYREISSCSNCCDFQARRAKIRFRPEPRSNKSKPKPELAHTQTMHWRL